MKLTRGKKKKVPSSLNGSALESNFNTRTSGKIPDLNCISHCLPNSYIYLTWSPAYAIGCVKAHCKCPHLTEATLGFIISITMFSSLCPSTVSQPALGYSRQRGIPFCGQRKPSLTSHSSRPRPNCVALDRNHSLFAAPHPLL